MNTETFSLSPDTNAGRERQQACLWYAWGRFDQAHLSIPPDVHDWAREMGRCTDRYSLGSARSLPSVIEMTGEKYPELFS